MTLEITSPLLPYVQVIAFGFGVIIGSFLNVVIYRLHTGKSLAGHSHCLSCGTRLTWFELFPLLSYLVLRGSCRSCGCHIPIRYFLVEFATGLLFVFSFNSVVTGGSLSYQIDLIELLLWWSMVAIMVVIVVYDIYHFIIPDRLTIYLTIIALGLIGWDLFSWLGLPESVVAWQELGIDLLWQVGAALAGAGFFLFLWIISKGKWLGFGDVKLAVPLGLLVGADSVFTFVVLSFWIGAGCSLFLMGILWLMRGKPRLRLTQKQITMKNAVPFAPFLIASALVVLFTEFDAFTLFSF